MPKTLKTSINSKNASQGKSPLYNLKAEKIGDVTLKKNIFAIKTNNQLIAQAVRIYLSNQRHSQAKVKDRGEVSGTTKKMWAQKGTGRARHGSAKAGIFVGGGIAHGPQGNQNYQLTLNKKTKKLAINSLLTQFAKDHRILVIDDFKELASKTKEALKLINSLEENNETLAKSLKIAIITDQKNQNVFRAFSNIPGFQLFTPHTMNTYNLANQNFLIFDQKSLESI